MTGVERFALGRNDTVWRGLRSVEMTGVERFAPGRNDTVWRGLRLVELPDIAVISVERAWPTSPLCHFDRRPERPSGEIYVTHVRLGASPLATPAQVARGNARTSRVLATPRQIVQKKKPSCPYAPPLSFRPKAGTAERRNLCDSLPAPPSATSQQVVR